MSALLDSVSALDLRLGIGGMSCASCVSRVEKALLHVAGVTEVSVKLATDVDDRRQGAQSGASDEPQRLLGVLLEPTNRRVGGDLQLICTIKPP